MSKKEYEVHFAIRGYYYIDANNKEEAERIVNNIIDERIEEFEYSLHTGLKDGDYVTEVLDSPFEVLE